MMRMWRVELVAQTNEGEVKRTYYLNNDETHKLSEQTMALGWTMTAVPVYPQSVEAIVASFQHSVKLRNMN